MRSLTKWILPIAISVVTLAYLFQIIDFSSLAKHITPRVAMILIPALIAYGIVSLVIEAFALRRTLHSSRTDFTLICAARV